MGLFPIVVLALVLDACASDPCDDGTSWDTGVRGKGLNRHSSLDWIQRLAIKPPKFSYNAKSACDNTLDMALTADFIDEIKWAVEILDKYNVTDLNFLGPSTYLCSTNDSDPDYHNNVTCPANGSYVSTPYYFIDDLQYSLPSDGCPEWHACKFTNDTDCLCYDWMNSTLTSINSTGKFREELSKQQKIAEQNYTISSYRRIHDYLGVGYNISQSCRANVNAALNGTDNVDQAGWQAATTLSALIPALLTIGNLFVPRSSEAFATSFLIGLLSAFFSLGLPVRSISGIKGSQTFDLGSFDFKARRFIANIGKVEDRGRDGKKDTAKLHVAISELQKYSVAYDENRHLAEAIQEEQSNSDLSFSTIRNNVQQWSGRVYYFIPSFLIVATQVTLFIVAIAPLYFAEGTPFLLFDCRNYLTATWVSLAAAISAVFRFMMWEKSSHERVKLYALSGCAILRFRDFTTQASSSSSVEKTLPPLYPPVLAIFKVIVFRAWCAFWSQAGFYKSRVGTFHVLPTSRAPSEPGTFVVVKNDLRSTWYVCMHNLRYPGQFIKAAFWPFGSPGSGRRWRPLYLLLHRSTNGRNPLKTLFTGLVEGFILILLTIFFAAQWGGNMFVMSYTLVLLLVYITLGRALGLVHVQLTSIFYGLHMIETHDRDQIRGCLRILCSMQETLVDVNGAWYFEGHRLDICKDWAMFQNCYNFGHMDDTDSSRRCDCAQSAHVSSAQLLPTSSMTQLPSPGAPQLKPVTSTAISSANGTTQSSLHSPT